MAFPETIDYSIKFVVARQVKARSKTKLYGYRSWWPHDINELVVRIHCDTVGRSAMLMFFIYTVTQWVGRGCSVP